MSTSSRSPAPSPSRYSQARQRLLLLCVIRTACLRVVQRALRSSDPVLSLGWTTQEAEQHLSFQKSQRTRHLKRLELLQARLLRLGEWPVELLQLVWEFTVIPQGRVGADGGGSRRVGEEGKKMRGRLMLVCRGWREGVLATPGVWPAWDEWEDGDSGVGGPEKRGTVDGRRHPAARRLEYAHPVGEGEPTTRLPRAGMPEHTLSFILEDDDTRSTLRALTLRDAPSSSPVLAQLSSLSPDSLPALRSLTLLEPPWNPNLPSNTQWAEKLYSSSPHLAHLCMQAAYPLPLSQASATSLHSLVLSRPHLSPADLTALSHLSSLRSLTLAAQSLLAPPSHPLLFPHLHTLSLEIADHPSCSALLSALLLPQLRNLKFGPDLPHRQTWSRPTSAWLSLAQSGWEPQTLWLGMGGDSDEWLAQLQALRQLAPSVRTWVVGFHKLERLALTREIPEFGRLEELVVMDEGVHKVASLRTLHTLVRMLLSGPASGVKRLRFLSRTRQEPWAERKRYTTLELGAWRALCARLGGEVYVSWAGCPFDLLREEAGGRGWWEGPGNVFAR